ncbi:MAG: polyhydroxyalkanoic acid system family protein [Myxococcota bacterium]|jgi:hypothetical protein|nr:polyhydroxyalkanoic acid system family protein [Myxococcota bacterium]
MPKIARERSHTLSMDEAKQKVQKIVEDVKQSYPSLVDSISWNADQTAAKVKGKMFSGDFEVSASKVKIHIDLSFLATPFLGKVESRIDAKIIEYFGG